MKYKNHSSVVSGVLTVSRATMGGEKPVVAPWRAAGLRPSVHDQLVDFYLVGEKNSSNILVCSNTDQTIIRSLMVGRDGHRG